MRGKKGQLFSIDFLVAMGLVVLVLGVTISAYETAAIEEKETKVQNELNAIAANAGNLILELNKCGMNEPDPADTTRTVKSTAYMVYGCYNTGAAGTNFNSTKKEQLMIPVGFGCSVTWRNSAGQSFTHAECGNTIDSAVADVASLQRTFLGRADPITKKDYDKCIEAGCTAYEQYTMNIKVWKLP